MRLRVRRADALTVSCSLAPKVPGPQIPNCRERCAKTFLPSLKSRRLGFSGPACCMFLVFEAFFGWGHPCPGRQKRGISPGGASRPVSVIDKKASSANAEASRQRQQAGDTSHPEPRPRTSPHFPSQFIICVWSPMHRSEGFSQSSRELKTFLYIRYA